MQEKLKHQKAFDFYYSLGGFRSYSRVAQRFSVSKTSVQKWSKEFNWQKRIKQRDISNAKRLQAKTDKVIIDTKAQYRADVSKTLHSVKLLLQSVQDTQGNFLFTIKNISDFKKTVDVFRSLVSLGLELMDEREQETLKVNREREEKFRKLSEEQRKEMIEHLLSAEKILNEANQEDHPIS